MNRKIRYMALAAVACFVASFASAGVVFTDTFDYTEGNAMLTEGGWTAWSETGGSDAGSGVYWGNGSWLEYNGTNTLAEGNIITMDANVNRPGSYSYIMTLFLWDGSDSNTIAQAAGGVPESPPTAALTTVSYTVAAADVGKKAIFRYAHGATWGETLDVTFRISDPAPPIWNTDPIQGAGGTATITYVDTLAGLATDPNGDVISYSKVGGPDWLIVATDGALSGIPGTGDIGLNTFTVEATDGIHGASNATLNITVTAFSFDPAESPAISINFSQSDSNQGFTEADQYIGPRNSISTNWNSSINRSSGTLATGEIASLTDDNGIHTGASVSWSSGGVVWNADGTGDDQHRLAVGSLSETVNISVSGIPYSSYEVYGLFTSPENAGLMEGLDFEVNNTWVYGGGSADAATPVYGSINGNNAANGAYWTQTIPGVSTGNYWVVATTGPTLNIDGQLINLDIRGTLAGLIIRNLDLDPQPPEWLEIPVETTAIAGREIGGTLADKAIDRNDDVISFSKASGDAWLMVAANGDLSGAPPSSGTNVFEVVATDGTTPVTNILNVVIEAGLPPEWTTNMIQGAVGLVGYEYSGSLAGQASDPNGDAITFSKDSGPAWLTVAADGSLSGIPGIGDIGANGFAVSVTDGFDGTNSATLNIEVAPAPSTILVDNTTANGSFELPASGKIQFNTGNVPDWTNWSEVDTADDDTGADAASAGTHNGLDGARIAFLQGGGAIVNMVTNSPHTIQKGDVIVYSFWNSLLGRGAAAISLVYDDGGVRTQIPGTALTADAGTQQAGVLTVQEGDAWIGSTLGVGIAAVGAWPEVDQVYLALSAATAGQVTDVGIGVVAGGAQVAISWTGEATGTYTVQTNSNLIITSGWADYMTGIPGVEGPVSVTNTIGSDPALFYRVITE